MSPPGDRSFFRRGELACQFFVAGIPATAGSKRHVGGGRMIHDNKRWPEWKAAVAANAVSVFSGELLDEPITIRLTFHATRPKSHYGTGRNSGILKLSAPVAPASKPDLTKLVRAVEDALTGIVWEDDARVVEQVNRKQYGDKPGVMVQVYRVENK